MGDKYGFGLSQDRMSRNNYIIPVPKDAIKRITFRESPYHVKGLKHSVDFIVDEGTPVFAALDGEVLHVKDDSNKGGAAPENEEFGNFIEIRHCENEFSEYEHLQYQSSRVKKCDTVYQGQIIGYSGATGVLAHLGPHLHFMVGHYDFDSIPISFTNLTPELKEMSDRPLTEPTES
jgi:murein DD-endopeptidase MepM/ murein hydrolase activator NlpD